MKTRFFTTIALAVLFLSSCVKEDNNNQITKDKDSNYTKTGNIPFYLTTSTLNSGTLNINL